MTSVASIKLVQDGLRCSPAATVIQHGGHTYSIVYTLEVAFAVEFEALASTSTKKSGMTSYPAHSGT